jgi:competence protein ComFC
LKCILCSQFSISIICKNCQKIYLKPNKYCRVTDSGLKVYSFYKYDDIKSLLYTKHSDLGWNVYKILAKNSFYFFKKEFEFPELIYAVGVDDRVKNGYSHTAILTKELKSKTIKPLFKALRSTNSITYSSKSLEYRKANPRNFKIDLEIDLNLILVDDIITTGTTLDEAAKAVKKAKSNAIFALTLADADN